MDIVRLRPLNKRQRIARSIKLGAVLIEEAHAKRAGKAHAAIAHLGIVYAYYYAFQPLVKGAAQHFANSY